MVRLPTYEDTYNLCISIDKNSQEKVRIYEIGGQNSSIARHFVNSADALILVYDLTDFESFATLQNLKADIDSMKDRREIPTVIIGNKSDQPRNNKFETFLPSVWSQREKIAYYEMNTLPSNSIQLLRTQGSGPLKPAISPAYSHQNGLLFAGHADGFISVIDFSQRRQISSWLAHSDSQVIGLAVSKWPATRSQEERIISQGRDGKIRFWKMGCHNSSQIKPIEELDCCSYTLCPFHIWPANNSEHFLVYVNVDDTDASAVNLEVIRSLDNLIVSSVDASRISKFGMCMALRGIAGTEQFLCGFEVGCVVLFDKGLPVASISPLSPTDTRPITCLDVFVVESSSTMLIAVGKAAFASDQEPLPDFEVLKLSSEDPSKISLERCAKPRLGDKSFDGVSSLAWRSDGQVLAAGLWNGDIRIFAVTSQGRSRYLGSLRSPGAVVGGGTLMGDWASISGAAPGNQDQSLSVRGCLFLPYKWLVTTAPASAMGLGALNVWDAYRD
ncbi:hypothetical protein ACTXT7_000834 [Hymenolepis weldensis]